MQKLIFVIDLLFSVCKMVAMKMQTLIKYRLEVDGIAVGAFFAAHLLNPIQARQLEDEYASAHWISSGGVHVYRIKNDHKINKEIVIPHLGKVR